MNIKMLLADEKETVREVAHANFMDNPLNYKVLSNKALIINYDGVITPANIVEMDCDGIFYVDVTNKIISDTSSSFEVIREATFEELRAASYLSMPFLPNYGYWMKDIEWVMAEKSPFNGRTWHENKQSAENSISNFWKEEVFSGDEEYLKILTKLQK